MKKIIIDCDPGVDDAFALVLASSCQDLDILGVTTVAGNCSLENATNNTFKVLDMVNRNDISVYAGSDKSLIKEDVDAEDVHGIGGLGGVEFEKINRSVENINAIDYLISEVNKFPGDVSVVALGPLTNIALAIRNNRDFASNIKELVIMGGAVGKGNITEDAEFNFYKDPDAAKEVFDNFKGKIVMVGLDVTRRIPLTKELEHKLLEIDTPLSRFLYDITRNGAEFDRKQGFDGLIINDPLTIAYLIDREMLEFINRDVDIDLDTAKSVIKDTDHCDVLVAVDVEVNKFYKMLFKSIFDYDL